MDMQQAIAILERNYNCLENSLLHDLHEKYIFSAAHFWDYYDCVITLARDAITQRRSIDNAMKITFVYQHILKEILFHFDADDGCTLQHLPSNYPEYIERLDGAVNAFFQGVFIEESIYNLKR